MTAQSPLAMYPSHPTATVAKLSPIPLRKAVEGTARGLGRRALNASLDAHLRCRVWPRDSHARPQPEPQCVMPVFHVASMPNGPRGSWNIFGSVHGTARRQSCELLTPEIRALRPRTAHQVKSSPYDTSRYRGNQHLHRRSGYAMQRLCIGCLGGTPTDESFEPQQQFAWLHLT